MVGLFAATGGSGEVWAKTFPPSARVIVEKVTFKNRVSHTVVGDLYVPKDTDRARRHRAIVVGHPFGGSQRADLRPAGAKAR